MEEENVELTEQEELEAITAGFGGTDIEPVQEENTTVQPQEEEPEAPAEPAEPEAPKYLTQDDLNAAVERMLQGERSERQKLHDRLYGKIGELQQKINSAKTAATGLSPKAREKMMETFPELAELLWDEETPEPAPQLPQVDFNEVLTQRVNETQQQFEKRLLKRDHPDWEQVVAAPDFATWKNTVCPLEDAAALDETWDADFVSSKLSEFKTWKASQQTAQVTEQQRRAEAEQKAKERLEAAVLPTGKPRVSATDIDDEEAAMLKAFGEPRIRR